MRPPRPMDSLLRIVLLTAVLLVVGPTLLVACACRAFLYHPTRAETSKLAVGRWEAVDLAVADEVVLKGLMSPPKTGPSAEEERWILFFGGNAMSLVASRSVLEQLSPGRSFGLAAFAYRGYDGSGGEPKQAHLTADAEAIAAFLEAHHGVKPRNLIVLGQSLGTGVAVHLAAHLARQKTPPAGLGLISPYTSMARVFDDHVPVLPIGWAVSDSYRSERLAPELAPPIVIVHGSADEVIPVRHAHRLAAMLGEKVRLVELPGRHHNDLWDDPRTVEALTALFPAPEAHLP